MKGGYIFAIINIAVQNGFAGTQLRGRSFRVCAWRVLAYPLASAGRSPLKREARSVRSAVGVGSMFTYALPHRTDGVSDTPSS